MGKLNYLLYILTLVLFGIGISYALNFSAQQQQTATTNSTPTPETNDAPQNTPTSQPATPAVPAASPNKSSVKVKFIVEGTSWVIIKVDGKTEVEQLLYKGYIRTWVAKELLSIRAGNPGVISYIKDDGEPQPLGELGIPKTVTFTPGGS